MAPTTVIPATAKDTRKAPKDEESMSTRRKLGGVPKAGRRSVGSAQPAARQEGAADHPTDREDQIGRDDPEGSPAGPRRTASRPGRRSCRGSARWPSWLTAAVPGSPRTASQEPLGSAQLIVDGVDGDDAAELFGHRGGLS